MIDNKIQLLTLMQQGAIVITPNNRLSNELIQDYFADNAQHVQAKPRCFPYSAFLKYSFKLLSHKQPLTHHPLLLNAQQLSYLWYQILSTHNHSAINDGLLTAVEEAWARCQLWQIDFNDPAFLTLPQTRQFQYWSNELQKTLDKLGAITEAQLVKYLITKPNYLPENAIVWACFDDFTPQQQALQTYHSQHGIQRFQYDLGEQRNDSYLFAAADEQDEYQQLIFWLNKQLRLENKRIAVVVPDLHRKAKSLQRVLQQHIPNEQFSIFLGQALSDYPLVAQALQWLSLDPEQLTNEEAQLLLHSPYLSGSQSEMLARADINETSELLKERYFTKLQFVQAIKSNAPLLASILEKTECYPCRNSPQGWIDSFKNRLHNLGFPGEYSLNSAVYQCYQRFINLFDEFRQLTLLTDSMTVEQALYALKKLAKSTVFQPQQIETPIQIFGLLEASGCTFNSLWVTGLDDSRLPQKSRLSAYIPLALQRDNLMPHASPIRELQLAQKTLTRLCHSSPYNVFSYSRLNNDTPSLPSPLIKNFPQFSIHLEQPQLVSSVLVSVQENYEIPFKTQEKAAGGTAILANQAKCPFRAFAAHRLHAKAVLEISEGPDAKERGQLIHKVMELLWQTLKNQQRLLALNAAQLDEYIEQAIKEALKPLINFRTYSFSNLIQDLELVRLKRLVHHCLQWEKQRPSFAVEAIEEAFTISLAGIDFRVRVDRLDRDEQGKKWVIDYKSSLPQSLPWKEDRPQEPQLLLYALLDETINGLLFLQLKTGQLTCKGFSEERQAITGISSLKKDENWQQYREGWQAQLEQLASEFAQGHCLPQPAKASLCQRCDYQTLCRFSAHR